MEYVKYFSLKIFLLIFHVSNISIHLVQNHNEDKLKIEDTDSVCEIKLPLIINPTLI